MRTLTLPISFLTLFMGVFPVLVFADSVDSVSRDRQFQPKVYIAPPLHSTTSLKPAVVSAHKRPPAVKPKLKLKPKPRHIARHGSKRRPLEVQRLQMKKKPHLILVPNLRHSGTTHRRHHLPKLAPNILYKNLQHHQHLSNAVVHPGSLRLNIQRIADKYGWHRVVWMLPQDYRWLGETRIMAHGLPGILEKLLTSYPVQAEFYEGNHVLVIHPRTI
jgi:hypothetical protein